MRTYQKVSLFFAFIVGIFIFYISSISSPPTIPGISYTSLIYHFGIFFMLGFFIFTSGDYNRKVLILLFAICLIYAGLDELHQYFVPGRVTDIVDFMIDSCGIFSSFSFISLLTKN